MAESVESNTSRRDLLKKAGVGAAIVWTAPIVTSAVTPAAAQTGIITSFDDASSLNANCSGDNCGEDDGPEWGNSGNPGVIRIRVLSPNDTEVTVHQAGDQGAVACAFNSSEATVTQTPSGYSCVITEVFLNCGAGGNTEGNFTPIAVAVPATTVPVPACDTAVVSSPPCRYFIRAAVSCTAN